MKKVLMLCAATFTGSMTLLLAPTHSTAAATTQDTVNTEHILDGEPLSGQVVYEDPEIIVTEDPEYAQPVIQGRATTTAPGNAGFSRLVKVNSQHLTWHVAPAAVEPWIFKGTVKLRYFSGFKRDVPVTTYGFANRSSGGHVYMNANKGGKAYLSGTAYTSTWRQLRVVPGVNIKF